MVGAAPRPSGARRIGLYWIYVGLLSIVSIFYLAVVSPIIRPTLPTNPSYILFCIFAGIAIADAAAHALDDIAGIWKPHDLGGALTPRKKFNAGKVVLDDAKGLLAHLTAVPIIAAMACAYTLLPARIEDRFFGSAAGQGAVLWNFMSQSILGGLEVFAFFLSHETRATLRDQLYLVELQPLSFEAGAILAGLKLYGLLISVATLRLLGAPIVLVRTWLQSRKNRRRKTGKEAT